MNQDLFSFLKQPSLTAAAIPETSSLVIDEFDSKLKEFCCWPHGMPANLKSHDNLIRFHYRETNDSQAKIEFHNILLLYRNHVIILNVRKWEITCIMAVCAMTVVRFGLAT